MEKTKNNDENISGIKKITLAIFSGAICGLINGLFGGGGGMIIVPILIYFFKYLPKNAHATAILIILPLTIVSSIFYLCFGNFQLNLVIPVGIGVVGGGVVGALLLSKLSSRWLVLIFSVVMLVAGVKMLFF